MALVIWSLTSERRLLRSIACGPEKIFFYLAHLATQGAVIGLATMFLLPGGRGEQYSYQAEARDETQSGTISPEPEITVIG